MVRSSLPRFAAAALALPLLLGGCAASGAQPLSIATEFTDAVASGDGADACALLTQRAAADVEEQTGSPCAAGVVTLDLPSSAPSSAEAWGGEAFAESTEAALFLTRDGDSWLVRAAGCVEAVVEAPFECIVDGS